MFWRARCGAAEEYQINTRKTRGCNVKMEKKTYSALFHRVEERESKNMGKIERSICERKSRRKRRGVGV